MIFKQLRWRLVALITASFSLGSNTFAQVPGTELWHFDAQSPVSSPAIGSDGTIYFTARGNLWAIDPSGSNRWSRFDNFVGTPALDPNGIIYIGLASAGFRAISDLGVPVWVVDRHGYDASSAFAVATGIIYFSDGRELLAVNRHGIEQWTHIDTVSGSTIGQNGMTYYLAARSIWAVRPNGKALSKYFYLGNEAITPMAIGEDGTIYCGWEGGRLCAVNPDLSRKWLYDLDERPEGGYLIREPAIGPDGTIYFPTLRYGLCAMSPCGTNLWKFKAEMEAPFTDINAPAVADDGTIYMAFGTNFFAINPDGTERWRFSARYEFHSSAAIGGDGTVYVGCDDGRLYALKGTARLARSAWPMEGHDLRRSRKGSYCRGEPCFETPFRSETNEIETLLIGEEGREYSVWKSTDLVNWNFHTNLASANGACRIVDGITERQGFYKAAR